MIPNFDFTERPFLVIWETTRACDLACVHCRASADPNPAPDELTHEEAHRLVREVREMGTPILVFSGGASLKMKKKRGPRSRQGCRERGDLSPFQRAEFF